MHVVLNRSIQLLDLAYNLLICDSLRSKPFGTSCRVWVWTKCLLPGALQILHLCLGIKWQVVKDVSLHAHDHSVSELLIPFEQLLLLSCVS